MNMKFTPLEHPRSNTGGYSLLYILLSHYGFKNFYNLPNKLYLSGSSVIKLIEKKKLSEFNDLDLYVERGMDDVSADMFIKELISAGFLEDKTNKSKKLRNYLMSTEDICEVGCNEDYFSLRDQILSITSLQNHKMLKIDIIVIRNTMEDMLVNTFDYNFLKNYMQINVNMNNPVMCYAPDDITSMDAKMRLFHFTNRVIHNEYEFNNFIKRVIKYSKRYSLYIGEKEISKDVLNKIVECIMSNIKKEYKSFDYTISNDKNYIASVLLKDTIYEIDSFSNKNNNGLFIMYASAFRKNKKEIVEELCKIISTETAVSEEISKSQENDHIEEMDRHEEVNMRDEGEQSVEQYEFDEEIVPYNPLISCMPPSCRIQ